MLESGRQSTVLSMFTALPLATVCWVATVVPVRAQDEASEGSADAKPDGSVPTEQRAELPPGVLAKVGDRHVTVSEYAGHDLVNFRVFANYQDDGGEKRPTKKGVSIKLDRLPEVIEALKQAEQEAKQAGLLEG